MRRLKLEDSQFFNEVRLFKKRFPNENACLKWFINYKYKDGKVICPNCKGSQIYKRDKHFFSAGSYICKNCRKMFNIKDDTEISSLRLPMYKYFMILYITNKCNNFSSTTLGAELNLRPSTVYNIAVRAKKLKKTKFVKSLIKSIKKRRFKLLPDFSHIFF